MGILLLLFSRKWFLSVKQLGIEVVDNDVPPSLENSVISSCIFIS